MILSAHEEEEEVVETQSRCSTPAAAILPGHYACIPVPYPSAAPSQLPIPLRDVCALP